MYQNTIDWIVLSKSCERCQKYEWNREEQSKNETGWDALEVDNASARFSFCSWGRAGREEEEEAGKGKTDKTHIGMSSTLQPSSRTFSLSKTSTNEETVYPPDLSSSSSTPSPLSTHFSQSVKQMAPWKNTASDCACSVWLHKSA